jgi:Dockerin type I domain
MKKITLVLAVIVMSLSMLTTYVLAQEATSPNYGVTTQNGQKLDPTSSANFGLPCSIAGFLEQNGVSSVNYTVTNLDPCPLVTFQIQFKIAPEKRVQNTPPNLASLNTEFSIRPAGFGPFDPILYRSADLGATDPLGVSTVQTITIPSLPGGYDVSIKTEQGLSRKLANYSLNTSGINYIDFSVADTVFVKGGDSAGTIFGDNKVNSLDIGTTINDLNGATPRPDYNRDGKVNALDIGILIYNLNQIGE